MSESTTPTAFVYEREWVVVTLDDLYDKIRGSMETTSKELFFAGLGAAIVDKDRLRSLHRHLFEAHALIEAIYTEELIARSKAIWTA